MFSLLLTIIIFINSVQADTLPYPLPEISNYSVSFGVFTDTLFLECPSLKLNTNIPTKTINGRIVDSESGEPLIGAILMEKGTSNKVVSDNNGSFSITIAEDNYVIITYPGFKPKKIKPVGNNFYRVELIQIKEQIDIDLL